MVEKIYDKLVRDNVPNIINNQDRQTCKYRVLKSEDEYFKYLVKKVVEEIHEFYEDPTNLSMADVVEVLLTIGHLKNLDYRHIEKARMKKLVENGGFTKKYILESVKHHDK